MGLGERQGVRTPWKCSQLCGLILSPDRDVDTRGDASEPAPVWASSCVQVRRPSGLFSWSGRSVGLTSTLVRPVVTPPAWHCPGLDVAGRALCCGPRVPPSCWTRRGLCPLCGPHCRSVMSTFDSCEQPKSCPCVIWRACVSPMRG